MRRGRCYIRRLALVLALLVLAFVPAMAAPGVPRLSGRVTDEAHILSRDARDRISNLLTYHEGRTTNQVAVLTVPSLEGGDIESFAVRVFEKWKLGRKGKDNGVLVLIASQDRRMRIEVGYGLEGELTDLECGRIIRNIMTPRFKAGDFDVGVTKGVQAIIAKLEGRDAAIPADAPASQNSFFKGPDLSFVERILFGSFIYGLLGLFTVIGVFTPGIGWFLYLFLIPFWAMFPFIVVGGYGALITLGTYLVTFPIAKIIISRSKWYKKATKGHKTKGGAKIGGFMFSSGGSSSGGWSSSGGSSGFSGGGGSSGGGGASGGW